MEHKYYKHQYEVVPLMQVALSVFSSCCFFFFACLFCFNNMEKVTRERHRMNYDVQECGQLQWMPTTSSEGVGWEGEVR